jgi:selenide,water dikinase
VLAENLRRAVRGRPLKVWRPQREALVIMGLGEGRGLAWGNGIALWGRPIWCWKDWIDRNWIRRFVLRATPAPGEQFRCGGADAQLDSAVLNEVLCALGIDGESDGPLGPAARDAVAAARPPSGMLVVQSADHFRACLDDPFVLGEIAAAHAMSDVYATGAQPWTALAIAAVTLMPADKMRADLVAMLQGAQRLLRDDGCTLAGVCCNEALETSLGFAVTGLVEPRLAWRKSGLRDGDALVLTKPLGTGVLLAGHMRGLTKARWLVAASVATPKRRARCARMGRLHALP